MNIDKSLLDKLLKGAKTSEDLFGRDGIVQKLKKAMVERMLEAEMSHHLGYEKHGISKYNGNYRNGTTSKKVITENDSFDVSVPRDRTSSFEPKLIGKYQRRLPGFDEKIISMYARGMTTRDIQQHIEEIYQTTVSPDLISTITDEVIQEVEAWQGRPLDKVYPVVYLDAIVVKIRDSGHVQNKSLYLAIGINIEGNQEGLQLIYATFTLLAMSNKRCLHCTNSAKSGILSIQQLEQAGNGIGRESSPFWHTLTISEK